MKKNMKMNTGTKRMEVRENVPRRWLEKVGAHSQVGVSFDAKENLANMPV